MHPQSCPSVILKHIGLSYVISASIYSYVDQFILPRNFQTRQPTSTSYLWDAQFYVPLYLKWFSINICLEIQFFCKNSFCLWAKLNTLKNSSLWKLELRLIAVGSQCLNHRYYHHITSQFLQSFIPRMSRFEPDAYGNFCHKTPPESYWELRRIREWLFASVFRLLPTWYDWNKNHWKEV